MVDLRVDCELVSEAIPAPKMVPAICDALSVPSYCKKYFHIQEERGLWHHTTQHGKKGYLGIFFDVWVLGTPKLADQQLAMMG